MTVTYQRPQPPPGLLARRPEEQPAAPCDSPHGNYLCTLPRGHAGPHEARGPDGELYVTWPVRLDGSQPAEQRCHECGASSLTVPMDPVCHAEDGVAVYLFACRGRDCGAGKRPPVTHTLVRIHEAVQPA